MSYRKEDITSTVITTSDALTVEDTNDLRDKILTKLHETMPGSVYNTEEYSVTFYGHKIICNMSTRQSTYVDIRMTIQNLATNTSVTLMNNYSAQASSKKVTNDGATSYIWTIPLNCWIFSNNNSFIIGFSNTLSSLNFYDSFLFLNINEIQYFGYNIGNNTTAMYDEIGQAIYILTKKNSYPMAMMTLYPDTPSYADSDMLFFIDLTPMNSSGTLFVDTSTSDLISIFCTSNIAKKFIKLFGKIYFVWGGYVNNYLASCCGLDTEV